MNATQRRRASSIRSQLVAMSRDGWRTSKASDYLPLESELRALEGGDIPPSVCRMCRALGEPCNAHEAERGTL